MNANLQGELLEQAAGQGYELLEAESDRLFLSLDGSQNGDDRDALEELDQESREPDFMVLATAPGTRGALAVGWKIHRMMMLQLTEQGLNYRLEPRRSDSLED